MRKTAGSSSDGHRQDGRGETDAVVWPALCTKLPPGRVTNDEAFDLGVLCVDGTGDGIGLSLVGGAEDRVATDIELSPADVVFIARHILGTLAGTLAADALKEQASDLGLSLTKGGRGKPGGKADGAAVAFGGGTVAYLGLNDEQHQAKQQAAHRLGPDAAQLGGASAQEAETLVAKGLALCNDVTTLNAGRAEAVTEAQKIEIDRFETILTTSGTMDTEAAQKCLKNPHTTIGRNEGNRVIQTIHLDAIRAMATEQYGRPLDDKEWAGLSQQEEWKKCQNSGHMGAKLAKERATKIFEILCKAPLQLAKDYMAATISISQTNMLRPKGKAHSEVNKKKK